MKKYLALIFTICFCFLSGCGIKENTTVVLTTGFKNNEVFYIEHMPCTKEEFMIYLSNMKNQFASSFGNEIFEVSYNDVYLEDTLKDQVLEKLASVKIMNLMAEQKGITLEDTDITKAKNATNAYYSSMTQAEKEILGVDYELVLKMYEELALAKKVYNYLIADINPEISDDEARIITVQQIYIKTYFVNENGQRESISDIELKLAQERIEEAYAYILEGQDFGKVASEYSDEETLTVSFGKNQMNHEYEEIAASLSKGEVSRVFKTEDGYYILKCITTFNKEETDRNKVKIVEEKRKVVFEEEYNTFTKTLLRKLNTELFDEITVPQDDQLTSDDFFKDYESFINF